MSAKARRIAALRQRIPEVDPAEAFRRAAVGAVLVDVREPEEVAQGSPANAVRIPRGFLELKIEESVADLDHPLLTVCAGGTRSLFAAENLLQLGFTDVTSVAGGIAAWKREGLPVEVPRGLDAAARERYSRHLAIPEVGEAGQLRLLDSRVLFVGAGGLGSPAALYLAAAGVGTIAVVDDDLVDRSNLQRQILHTDAAVGTPKVDSARARLEALNPSITVHTHATRLTAENALELLEGYDAVVDGTDNFTARYLINDACVRLGIPNVHGSVFRFEGQVSVFWPGRPGAAGPCYRCVYPEPPPPELAPSCAEAGVLGVLPGVVGLLQAVETIKVLLGIGEPLIGRLLYYDALEPRVRVLELARNPSCPWCSGDEERELADVGFACAVTARQ
jgi:molybdopterin/thiamine biosynthesis adenylyltransferase/rhodanese-related sulfurtransferase